MYTVLYIYIYTHTHKRKNRLVKTLKSTL